ncbi:MAG: hypothetical protein AAGJ52_00295 [Pseudomonadota bacterium]
MNKATKTFDDRPVSSREFRDQIVGKTITSVVARPGRSGQPPVVLMMHFDDGSVVEFVSPRSDRLLKRSLTERVRSGAGLQADPANDSSAFELAQLPLPGCSLN